MTDEIELKLALQPGELDRVPHLGLVRGLRAGADRCREFTSTYYDTPELALARNGMALRIRHDGAGYVQTLKVPATADNHGGLQHMREVETRLTAPELASEPLEAELQPVLDGEAAIDALRPVFGTRIERREIPLAVDGTTVELALDTGKVTSGDAVELLHEAEFELKEGEPAHLYRLARMFTRHLDARLQERSKAARGHALFTARAPAPYKASKPALTPGMTVGEAFAQHAEANLRQVRGNIEAVLAGTDPEGVHKLRVGLRRLRALLDAFRHVLDPGRYAWLRGELRWLQQEMGPAREWDVFITETLTPLRARMNDGAALAALYEAAQELRAEAYERARSALATGRATAVLLTLEEWLTTGAWRPPGSNAEQQDAATYARAELDTRWKKLRKLGRKHARLDDEDLHRLRIRGKKLRYTGEAFAALFPAKPAQRHIKQVEALQETLGSLNDAATAERLLAEAHPRMAESDAGGVRAADAATAAVRGWLAAQVDRDSWRIGDAWAALADSPKFWRKKPVKA